MNGPDWGLGQYEHTANHPLAVAGRAVLEPRGGSDALNERLVAMYEEANEDPGGFRVTSRYVVATISA